MAPFRLSFLLIHLLVFGSNLALTEESTTGPPAVAAPAISEAVVEPGLFFDRQPEDLVVGRGQSARLDCLLSHRTEWKQQEAAAAVTWFQDGVALVLPDQRRRLLSNGSLAFDKVLHKRSGRAISDEGTYHCLAKSGPTGAIVSRNASVRVAVLDKDFTSFPTDTSANVGESVRFHCHINSIPDAVIAWEKDGQPIASVVSQHQLPDDSRFVALSTGVLHIYNAQVDDAGDYRCVASNELTNVKDRRSPAARLSVTLNADQPHRERLISPASSSPLWVSPGDSVTLECLSSSSPVRWNLNGAPLSPSNRTLPGPGYLTLSDVDPSAGGDYDCTATTGVQLNRTLATTSIRVATRPAFIVRPKSQVFPTAKTVRFECEVSGTPMPDIRWLKDGQQVPIGGRIINRMRNGGYLSELVLSNTVTTDSGVYQCWAANHAGNAAAAARLLVNVSEGTRPDPPSNLKATATSTTSAVLTWDPPANVPIEDVRAYTVHYMPLTANGASGGDEHQEVALNTNHRIDNLKRHVNYSFYVRVYVRRLASDESERIVFNPTASWAASSSTPPPRPPAKTLSPPGSSISATPNITLTPVSPTALKVTWRKSDFAVSLYKIQYRRHRAKDFDIEVVKGDVHEFTIIGLYPGRKYDVRVVPSGVPVAGAWFTKEMPRVNPNDGPSTAVEPMDLSPPAVELVVVNASSVLVTWNDTAPSGGRRKADDIRLTYRQQGSRESSAVFVLVPSGSKWVTQLSAGVLYEFHLAASADGQEGPVTSKSIRTLADAAFEEDSLAEDDFDPGSVLIESQVLSSSAVNLSWRLRSSETSTNHLLFTTVRYTMIPDAALAGAGPPTFPVVGYARSTANSVQLNNLTAFAFYRFAVRFHDRDGRSSTFTPASAEVRTLTDLPGAPYSPSWQMSSNGSVHLTWRPPLRPNGVILGYAILVSSNLEATLEDWMRQEEIGSRLHTDLTQLEPNVTLHYVRMQARTSAGWGALTDPLVVVVLSPSDGATSSDSNLQQNDDHHEQYLGVIIGLTVGFGFALSCVLFIVWRNRCMKSAARSGRTAEVDNSTASIHRTMPAGPSLVAANGASSAVNGKGFDAHQSYLLPSKPSSTIVRKSGGTFGRCAKDGNLTSQRASLIEMEAFVPMLSTIPLDDASHLDTKGGYPTGQGRRAVSLSNGSIHSGSRTSRRTMGEAERGIDIPLLSSVHSSADDSRTATDLTVLSNATETTCLSLGDSEGHSGVRRHRRRSSHDSSLHSLGSSVDGSSSGGGGGGSLRGNDDNDTGIYHADYQLNDSGMVVGSHATRTASSQSEELAVST